MPWNSSYPIGNQSVRQNKTPGQENTTYIEETLGNQAIGTNPNPQTAKDHFWNLDEYSGHHRFVQLASFVDNAASPTNPFLATPMNGCIYCKDKSSTEAPDAQLPEPFYLSKPSSTTHILQLGFRVLCSFRGVTSGQPVQSDYKYTHNVKPRNATASLTGIQRTDVGKYTIRFETALPTNNYIFTGSAIRNNSGNVSPLFVSIENSTNRSTVMATTFVKVLIKDENNAPKDPLFAMIQIVGG
jgi:hypothetical protein